MEQAEQNLNQRRVELTQVKDESTVAQVKIKELTVKSDGYKIQEWFFNS